MTATLLWFIEQPDGKWRIGFNPPLTGSGEIGHKRTFYGPDRVWSFPSVPVSEIEAKRWMHALCERGYCFTLDGKVTMRIPKVPAALIVGV